MSSLKTVYLNSQDGKRIALSLQKNSPRVYSLVSADGFTSLDGIHLGFEVIGVPDVINLDFKSDNYSCFGLSELLHTAELEYSLGQFTAHNLIDLQKGLDRLTGSLINTDEF